MEEYEVTTSNGYILGIQRIPHGKHETSTTRSLNKTPVLIQHGVLASSADFVLNSPNQSLGEFSFFGTRHIEYGFRVVYKLLAGSPQYSAPRPLFQRTPRKLPTENKQARNHCICVLEENNVTEIART